MAFFFSASKKNLGISCVLIKKEPNISQILLKLWLIGNRTLCRPIRSVIILVIEQIGLLLRGRPISLITRMITDRIGFHLVLLPLLIVQCSYEIILWFLRGYLAVHTVRKLNALIFGKQSTQSSFMLETRSCSICTIVVSSVNLSLKENKI